MRAALGTIWRHARLRRLLGAYTAAGLGQWAAYIAMDVYLFGRSGAQIVGVAMLLRTVPGGLLAGVLGVLVDRWGSKRIMVAADAARIVIFALMAVVASIDGPVPVLLALGALWGIAGVGFEPAQMAALPGLCAGDEDLLVVANTAVTTIVSVAIGAGTALGGALVAVSGAPAVFVLTAVLMAVSCVGVCSVTFPPHAREETPETSRASEFTAGLALLARDRVLRATTALLCAQVVLDGALTVLLVVVGVEALDAGGAGVGALNSALGIGGLLGAVIVLARIRTRPLGGVLVGAISLYGLAVAALAGAPTIIIATALMLVVGIANTAIDVPTNTLLQRRAPAHVAGRVFAAVETLALLSVGTGALLAPVLIHAAGLGPTLIILGLPLPLLALVLRGALREGAQPT